MSRFAALILAAALVPISAYADNLPRTIEKIKPSVVVIGSFLQTRTPPTHFRGTGFVVADGLHVITNAHVIPPVLDSEQKEIQGILIGQGEAARFREAKTVAIDKEHDLALLKISGDPLIPVKLASDSSALREGQYTAFTGFPLGPILGLYPVTHRAMVSCITPIARPVANSKQLDVKMIKRMPTAYSVFQLDGTAYPGNSGSPMYDPESGNVYGIINMVFIKSTKENAMSEPSGISYAIPGNYIRDMLVQAGLKP